MREKKSAFAWACPFNFLMILFCRNITVIAFFLPSYFLYVFNRSGMFLSTPTLMLIQLHPFLVGSWSVWHILQPSEYHQEKKEREKGKIVRINSPWVMLSRLDHVFSCIISWSSVRFHEIESLKPGLDSIRQRHKMCKLTGKHHTKCNMCLFYWLAVYSWIYKL